MKLKLREYLRWIGWFLVLLGLLGYLVKGSLGASWTLGSYENLAHVVFGLVFLAAAYWAKTASLIKWLVVFAGVAGLYFGLYGWLKGPDFYGYANLELVDNVIHLIIGLWALWLVWNKKK